MTDQFLLSICINTMNRADLLIETLLSILPFMNNEIEVIIFDASSIANETDKIQDFIKGRANILHIHSTKAIGIDEGYDLSVNYAKGKYCWPLPDDDPIFTDRIDSMLQKLKDGHDLILVNLECWAKDLSSNLQQPLFTISKDMSFSRNKGVTFWKTSGIPLSYIGSIIIKRKIWCEIDKRPFYGSYFAHVQVIMNSKNIQKIFLLAKPIIQYRSGNSSWTDRSFEIWNFLWVEAVWSNPNLTDKEKLAIVPKFPWKRKRSMLKSRAMGEYNSRIYYRFLAPRLSFFERPSYKFISTIPSTLLNYLILTVLIFFFPKRKYTIYCLAITNPNYLKIKFFLEKFSLKI